MILTLVAAIEVSIVTLHNGPQGRWESICKVVDLGWVLLLSQNTALTKWCDTACIWATEA